MANRRSDLAFENNPRPGGKFATGPGRFIQDAKTTGVPAIKFRTHSKILSEQYQGNNARVRVAYDVDWDLRWNFCRWMLGKSEAKTDNGRGWISRFLPQPYTGTINDHFPGDKGPKKYWLFATAVESIEGISPRGVSPTGSPLYEEARVIIVFETLSYRLVEDKDMRETRQYHEGSIAIDEGKSLGRYITRFIQPSAEYLALPFGRFRWAEGTRQGEQVTGTQLGYIIPSQEVVYIWHQIPRVQNIAQHGPPSYAIPSVIKKMLGSVNSTPFDYNSKGEPLFEKGTLLLTSVEVKPYRWIDGSYYSDITYKMKYLKHHKPIDGSDYDTPKGHNYFLHCVVPGADAFNKTTGVGFENYEHHLITHNGQLPTASNPGITLYRQFEFKDLFRPDAS